MTDLLEVRARRASSILELTIFDRSLDISALERLEGVLANSDARTRRIGQETRLRGYVLGLLVDCAARHQLGDAKSDRALAFITDFVQTEYAEPDGDHAGEVFDPTSFAVPDDGETAPESAFVLDRFLRRCEVTGRHDPGRDQAVSAFEAAGRRWSDVPDALRRHFALRAEMVDESIAELFADETWWTTYIP